MSRPRILVTRSRQQASALAAQLEAAGAEPILIPTIDIAPPESFETLDSAIRDLRSFDWILFTSANAVEALSDRLRALNSVRPPEALTTTNPESISPHPALASPLQIAAIGPSTAQALARMHLTPSLVPPTAVAESLAAALLPRLKPGARILLVRAEQARDTLPSSLREAGAHLTIAPGYRNLVPHGSVPLLRQLFATPDAWPDAITFTSSSTATNLLALLEAAGLALPADRAGGRTILRASIGPITSATLRELGYPPHVEAAQANIPALVEVLAARLRIRQP